MEQLVKAVINGHHEVDLTPDDDLNIFQKSGSDNFHVLHNNKSYQVHLLEINRTTKTIKFSIDHVEYDVTYKDEVDVMVEEMGLTSLVGSNVVDAVAPMPGLVLAVHVSSGEVVSEGQPLLILEAMKMENVIKAAHDGTIKDVLVAESDKVEKGQVLVTYEE